MADSTAPPSSEAPWHAAFPAPTVEPIFLPSEEIVQLLTKDQELLSANKPRQTIVVDLRRNDHDGRTILGALNLPAQTLYNSLPTLLPLLHAAGVTTVAYYCGSSRGRGSRAAAWSRDFLEREGNRERFGGLRAVAVEGGIKGWFEKAEKGGAETKFVGRTDR